MKKSKEQLKSELGVLGNPEFYGYFFSYLDYKYNQRTYYWSLHYNIKCLERSIVSSSFKDTPITGWRRQQTDWRSVNDLVLYDRFGSKMIWTEEPKRSVEVKLTDAGQEHWLLYNTIYTMGNVERLNNQIEKMYQLFPIKKDI